MRRTSSSDTSSAITNALAALLLCVLTAVLLCAPAPAHGLVPSDATLGSISLVTTDAVPDVAVPQKARDVLAEIERRNGEPPPGYLGGRTFGNRERRLPRGSYREYDVNRKVPGKNRGAERIVIEQRTGKAYYTADHYETFIPMNRGRSTR
jgi:guanyl-specific ribonuclease Sa